MQTSGVSASGGTSFGYTIPSAEQLGEATTFAENLAAAVQREREERAAALEAEKAQFEAFLAYQKEQAAKPSASESGGLSGLFSSENGAQSALLMMAAMMASGGGGLGGLGNDSSASSITGTSASTEMLMRVVPALMSLSRTEEENQSYAKNSEHKDAKEQGETFAERLVAVEGGGA